MAQQHGPPPMGMVPAQYPVYYPYAPYGGWGHYQQQYAAYYQQYTAFQHNQAQAQYMHASQHPLGNLTGGQLWMGYHTVPGQYSTSWQSHYGYPNPPIQYMHPGQQSQPTRRGQQQSTYLQFPGQIPTPYPQYGYQYNAQAQYYYQYPTPHPHFSFHSNQPLSSHIPRSNMPQTSAPNPAPVPNNFQAGFSAEGLARTGVSNTELANHLQQYVTTMPRDQRQKIQQPKGTKVEKKLRSSTYTGVKVTVFSVNKAVGKNSGKAKKETAVRIKKEKFDETSGLEASEGSTKGGMKIKEEKD